MLALPWRKYSIHELQIAGKRIHITETPNDSRGTGLILWDGAFVLGKYLERRFGPGGMKDKVVLELGSGTGLGGLCAAALGSRLVFLTDLEYVLPNLQVTIETNAHIGKGKVVCMELDWFNPDFTSLRGEKPDVILLADVAWVVELIPPLVDTIQKMIAYCHPKEPEIFLSHQTRAVRSDEILFQELSNRGLVEIPAKAEEYDPEYNGVNMYRIISKESLEYMKDTGLGEKKN